ncbi:MAG: nuclease-related domain-containing protein [Verrucomicrobiia bacterium]
MAGKGAHELGGQSRRLRKIIGLSAIGVSLAVGAASVTCWWGYHPSVFQSGELLLLVILFVIALGRIVAPKMDELFRREANAHQGARAEEKVGAMLDGLPKNYAVRHDVNTGWGNIDHLVFRRDGAVFLIETKSHSGRITKQDGQLRRNGQSLEKDFVKQTLDQVSWLKKFLKTRAGFEPWIHAAIVFTDAHVEKHLNLNRIDVFNASYLTRWLERARGNPRAAVILWPQVGNLKNKLTEPHSIHLAWQPLLR